MAGVRVPRREFLLPHCETAWLENYVRQLVDAVAGLEAGARDYRREMRLRERDRSRLVTARRELNQARREVIRRNRRVCEK